MRSETEPQVNAPQRGDCVNNRRYPRHCQALMGKARRLRRRKHAALAFVARERLHLGLQNPMRLRPLTAG